MNHADLSSDVADVNHIALEPRGAVAKRLVYLVDLVGPNEHGVRQDAVLGTELEYLQSPHTRDEPRYGGVSPNITKA